MSMTEGASHERAISAERVMEGAIRKMRTTLDDPVTYHWVSEAGELPLNPAIGKVVRLEFAGQINCVHCNRLTKKSFNQGYCYPCFKKLAQCDSCIVKPEKCHYAEGTCREPEWGDAHCNIEHVVYLSHTSAAKVGITRGTQVPTRWMDQGATQARPIARVATRHQSGLLEVALGQHIGDKTAWQTMLKGDGEPLDLAAVRDDLFAKCANEIAALQERFGVQAVQWLDDAPEVAIRYPVQVWPSKVKAHNFDKTSLVEGTLLGIKGQYLMLDTGVLNVRKFGGYHIRLEIQS